MSLPLESVREELLRAGVAPRYAGRYVVELREHLIDLTERERKAGLDARQASERARHLLGTDAQLARAMIDTAPRSLAAQAPWAVFALLPMTALVTAILIIVISMMRLLAPVHASWPGGIPNSYTGVIAAAAFTTSYLLGPAIAAASSVVAARQRLSSGWVWFGFGLVALTSSLIGFHMNLTPGVAGQTPNCSFSLIAVVFVNGRYSAAATLAQAAMHSVVLFTIAAFVFQLLRRRIAGISA